MTPTNTHHIIGIDPGLTGGVAHIGPNGLSVALNMPLKKDGTLDAKVLARLLSVAPLSAHAFIEQVHSRPRQAGQFNFGLNTGVIHGILYAYGIPFTPVSPQKWKAHYRIKREGEQTKADKKTEARAIASALWPEFAGSFKRVKDDGVAEAALIARYGASLIKEQQ